MPLRSASLQATMAPLRFAPFRILITGRVISMLGSSVAPFALAFAVLDLTGSARDLGYVVGVRTIFTVAFVLFGGAIADRLPRRALMVSSSIVAGASQATAAALLISHHATIPALLGLAALNGTTGALSQPASAAILPQTIPADMRKPGNALNRLASNTVSILGVSVAGLLVAAVGSGACVAIDAASFFIAAVFFARVRVPRVAVETPGSSGAAAPQKRPGIFRELREGWQEFRSHTWLWVVVLGFMFYNAATSGGQGVLGPAIANDTVGRKLWGVVLGAEAVGSILGAFVAMHVRTKRLLAYGTASCVTGAIFMFMLSLAPQFWPLLVTSFIAGLGIEQFGIAWETTMQENIRPDMLARVYSYDMLGSWVAMPIGQLAVGPAAAAFGTRDTVLVVAIIMAVATVAMLCSRSVRELRHNPGGGAVEPADPIRIEGSPAELDLDPEGAIAEGAVATP